MEWSDNVQMLCQITDTCLVLDLMFLSLTFPSTYCQVLIRPSLTVLNLLKRSDALEAIRAEQVQTWLYNWEVDVGCPLAI